MPMYVQTTLKMSVRKHNQHSRRHVNWGALQKCSILDEAWKLVSDIENVRQKTELCLKKTVSQRTQLSCLKLKKLEVTDVLKLKSIR